MNVSSSPRALFQIFKNEIREAERFDYSGHVHESTLGDQVALSTHKDFEVSVSSSFLDGEFNTKNVPVTIEAGSFVDNVPESYDVVYLRRGEERYRLTENFGSLSRDYQLEKFDADSTYDQWSAAPSLSFQA